MNLETPKLRNLETPRSGFTLVEMLIVVAILATLMSIMFRLGSLGGEDSKKANTIVKMQKIENCLSGYYAAFGSYPPVKVHGWHDIYHKVGDTGDQEDGSNGGALRWDQIHAACAAQPFGCEYPPDEDEAKEIRAWATDLKEAAQSLPAYKDCGYTELYMQSFDIADYNKGFRSEWDNPEWSAVKLFKFGVMSYLLPRYLFMMGGDANFFGIGSGGQKQTPCAQWGSNNDMPSNPFDGMSFDGNDDNHNGWKTVRNFAQTNKKDDDKYNPHQLACVANIPSQAVCARWMPNLEHLCSAIKGKTFFGVTVTPVHGDGSDACGLGIDEENPPDPGIHEFKSSRYKNATVSISDGWGREFYYYSPAPYQTYMLWSAGPNGYTFPPWMHRKDLNDKTVVGTGGLTVAECIKDDIMQMSH